MRAHVAAVSRSTCKQLESCRRPRHAAPGTDFRPGPSGTPTGPHAAPHPGLTAHRLPPRPPLTPSAALATLAGCATLTGTWHSGYWARGGVGSGTRRAGAPDQRDAGRCAEMRLEQKTGATRRACHHLHEAPRPAKPVEAPRPARRVAGKASSWSFSSDPQPRGQNYYSLGAARADCRLSGGRRAPREL